MASAQTKANQQEKLLGQLKETSNDFVIGDSTNGSTMGNDTLKHQTNGPFKDSEINFGNASQNQVIRNNNDDKMRKMVDNAVMTVENPMQDAILTAMDKMVIPRVEMAGRSITGSSGHGHNCVVQNSDRRDFTWITVNTPLLSAYSRLDLNIDQDRIDESRDVENFEDGDFSALKYEYDQRAHPHHTIVPQIELYLTKVSLIWHKLIKHWFTVPN